MRLRSRSRSLVWLVLALALVASLAAQDPKPVTGVKVAAPLTGAVTNASSILFDQANLTNVAGFRIAVDGGGPIDVGMPTTQAVLGGGGVTFSVPVSSLSLTNGAHVLTIYAYNDAGTLSSSPATINVVKS